MANLPLGHARRFTVGGRLRSLRFALHGIRVLVISQHNAWVHAAATLLVFCAGVSARISSNDWCWLITTVAAVWTAEAFNTALEFLCDLITPEFHPLIEKAKDIAAGAVLITSVGATGIGVLIFAPHFLEWLRT